MNVRGPQPLLPEALFLHELGLSTIPITQGQKKPAIFKWKQFQHQRADEATLRRWFGDSDNCQIGLGIVLGAVSGGVLVRDFDSRDAYAVWKRHHPELAKRLPTAQTFRGYHVYCRAEGYRPVGSKTFCRHGDDGELRGDGHYVVAPPSIHSSSGIPYRWLIEPVTGIPLIDLASSGLPPPARGGTQEMCCVSYVPCVCLHEGLAQALPEIIRRTLPTRPGQRHRQVFEFARHLRRFGELSDKEGANLESYVRQWHAAALPFIRTKNFATTFADFKNGWNLVRYPAGGGTLTAALQRAKATLTPAVADHFRDPRQRLLVGLCCELQRQCGSDPFFLSCRDAARAIGLDGITGHDVAIKIGRGGNQPHKRAWRWLKMLCTTEVGILKLISSGSRARHRANEYRYVAPLD